MPKATRRRCVACRKSSAPGELVRVVFIPAKGLLIEREQRLTGRGAYLHPRLACWRAALDAKRWERALRIGPGELSQAEFARFTNELSKLAV